MSLIYPTFSCFDDSMEFLEVLALQGCPRFKLNQHRLVHAVCVAPDGTRFAHAWVEHRLQKLAWLTGILDGKRAVYAMKLDEFYELYKPTQMTRYTPLEASRENYRTGTMGPWREEYQALCSDENRIRGASAPTTVLIPRFE